jgi:four helix bundle protein
LNAEKTELWQKRRIHQKYDLSERLIEFAVRIIELVEQLPRTLAGKHIGGELLRCGTSPAPNHAEAQGAESRRDFVHKMSIGLKELRETRVWLKITQRKMAKGIEKNLEWLLNESDELIKIFVSSIKTAERPRMSR